MSNVEDKDKPKNITKTKRTYISTTSSGLVRRGLDELSLKHNDKIRLLVVDDIPETRHNIKTKTLADDIVVVGEAGNGYEGLQKYYDLKPDVVCTNINMPDMDGITMTSLICERYPDAKVIMLTVSSGSDSKRRSGTAGALDFIEKPPTKEELSTAIRRVIEKKLPNPTRVLLDPNRALFLYSGKLSATTEVSALKINDEIPPNSTVVGIRRDVPIWKTFTPPEPLRFYDLIDPKHFSILIAEIDFMFSNITGHELSEIPFPRYMHTLNLLCTKAGEDGVDFSGNLSNTRILKLRGAMIDERTLSSLFSFTYLMWIDLSSNGITDKMVSSIEKAYKGSTTPKLGQLHLENNKLTGENLHFINSFPNLRRLYLRGNPITTEGLNNLINTLKNKEGLDIEVFLEGDPIGKDQQSAIRNFNSTHSSHIQYISNHPPFNHLF